ncbi:zona pellucida sperm-binding protein 4-like [Micropterus dolomieu]|uniref:zona pellucida sperm-binding protein 4-like n=1 Tax=Micropterus dolomieu TaxID=147949 RepID=UPI001E8EA188|nr:zona pellucida sperm-binding protein 4-like [Micropterus dolomieu]
MTCLFSAPELIMCSTDGRMTVVADLSLAVPSGGVPARTNLLDKHCGPREADDTRALFSFPVNSCGSIVKLGMETVTYENQIFFSKTLHAVKHQADLGNEIDRVTVQCTYALDTLYLLFSVYRFESNKDGVGRIVHSAHSRGVQQNPLIYPSAEPQTPVPTTRRRVSIRPGYRPPAHYIKVPRYLNRLSKKGTRSSGK